MGNNTRFTFNGELPVPDDQEYIQYYIQFPFTVPKGIESIIVCMEYDLIYVHELQT
jgi:hypothetical protein